MIHIACSSSPPESYYHRKAQPSKKSMMSGRRPLAAPPPPPPPATPKTTTTTTSTPRQDPPPPPPPLKSQIIPIVPTEFARIYNVTHPFVVLSLYYFSFPSIVANPVLALQYLLVPLSVLQLAYAVTCLPASSGRSGSASSSSSSKHKGKGKGKNAQGNNGLDLSGKVMVS